MRRMHFLRLWWRQRRGACLFCAAGAAAYVGLAALYRQPLEPALYATLLLAAAGAAALAVDFGRQLSRHARLEAARRACAQMASGELPEGLPGPEGPAEADLLALAASLDEARCAQRREYERRAREAGRYYTMWAHQIKTPIAAMRLLLQEDGRALGALRGELLQVEQYADMALQYQRLGQDLMPAPCRLEKIVRQAARYTAPLFIGKGISLHLGDLERTVVTDEKWMAFVLEQLLTNAVKYTPAGAVCVGLEGENTLVVSDTGIGISPQDLPRVFDWGFTGYNGRMDKRSTGIGLFLCRQALATLGHTIRIESAPGQGTRVLVGLGREELAIE